MSSVDQIFLPNPLQPATVTRQTTGAQPLKQTTNSPFAKILEQNKELKFSHHAQERLKSRNINFSQDQLQKLAGAVNNVAEKGGKESLVMMGDAALVVSIKNRTVVTAMDRTQMNGNIFTNIDSAVVL